MSLHPTGSQTVGPFFRIGLEPLYLPCVAGPDVPGEHVTIRGRVFDGDGTPVPDAMLETWQADGQGRYADPADTRFAPVTSGFQGFGRVATDARGEFALTTIKPGRVPGPGGTIQAPHLVVLVYMRGLLRHLVTRMYFPGDPGNESDPNLALVPLERRATLIAQRSSEAEDTLVWNVTVQGTNETVFFDV